MSNDLGHPGRLKVNETKRFQQNGAASRSPEVKQFRQLQDFDEVCLSPAENRGNFAR